MKITILTGYSGSGKSTALRYVEEHGYYCVDNLPGDLLNEFVSVAQKSDFVENVAIVIDARSKSFLKNILTTLQSLEKKHDVRIVFFDSDLETITRRFKETRLRHPLSLKGTIAQGYNLEKKLLNELRQRADLVIDTSTTHVHALKVLIHKYLEVKSGENFEARLMSFGYKYGVPKEADFVIDVRFLVNPFFENKLKKKTGKDRAVQKYIMADKPTQGFVTKTRVYLKDVLKRHRVKGKPFVTVAFGCTGGKHRSVFMAEHMKGLLKDDFNKVSSYHRDISIE